MLSLIEIPRDTSAVHMLVLWHHPEYEIRLYCWSSTCPRRKRDRLSTLDRKVSVQFPRLSSDRAVDYRNIQLNLLVCCHEKTNRCPISPLAILRYVCNQCRDRFEQGNAPGLSGRFWTDVVMIPPRSCQKHFVRPKAVIPSVQSYCLLPLFLFLLWKWTFFGPPLPMADS